ncbi:bifunctional 2-polyprenyl-6-hydroxyphenol methylase/3-demethylubiquinol 3-O-methyltransferase UbiG [Jatrophihabitans endophyticus]|uniref:class I SAM-dependent methyltransferase n=1 Tax=Jatrophihabitans endophyticus TaxID=1206085 RepID=UPI0019F24B6C|nr:class I SAM-dependent methyltransferase [Jatrophihabitans endophyticus]MBE7187397.1 class I SAM-dependent methyltransferase [Jatrophihabitans endophyticus]
MRGRQRWFTETAAGHSETYVRRFRALAADGADLDGEARFVDALLPRGARVLDAGCGPGRVGAALHARGHTVVGVDADPVLVEAAIADHPGPTWLVADLAGLDLAVAPFDLAVLAGNVMVFLEPGTEARVLSRLAAHVRPGGAVVAGFATDRPYTVADLDRDAEAAGLVLEHRFATWDLRPWHDDADWAVSVLRRP